jgi:hypothetical protein
VIPDLAIHEILRTLWVGFEITITVAGLLLMLVCFSCCVMSGMCSREEEKRGEQ